MSSSVWEGPEPMLSQYQLWLMGATMPRVQLRSASARAGSHSNSLSSP